MSLDADLKLGLLIFTPLARERSIVMSVCVCQFMSSRAYLRNYMTSRHQIRAWPLLGPLAALRCGGTLKYHCRQQCRCYR